MQLQHAEHVKKQAVEMTKFLATELMDDLAEILSVKQPSMRVTVVGQFLELLQDPVLTLEETEEMGRIWALDREKMEVGEIMEEDARMALLLKRGGEAMLKRARRRVFTRVHPDKFATAGQETHAKAQELFKSLGMVDGNGVPQGLLRSLCVASLQAHVDLSVVEALRAHLRSNFGLVCPVRRSRRVSASTPDGTSTSTFADVMREADEQREAAEAKARQLRAKRREHLEQRKKHVVPGSSEHQLLQMALVEMMQEEHAMSYEDAEYEPEPLKPTDVRLMASSGHLPEHYLAIASDLARSVRMLLIEGLPETKAKAASLRRTSTSTSGSTQTSTSGATLLDDDFSDEDADEKESVSEAEAEVEVEVVSGKRKRGRARTQTSTSTSTAAATKTRKRRHKGRSQSRTKAAASGDAMALRVMTPEEQALKLGIHHMLVLAFFWYGLPAEADSIRHSVGKSVIWLRHVVFVILELEVASRAEAQKIGRKEIMANEYLAYKNQRSVVVSPWNGFRKFLAELDKPEHAHVLRKAIQEDSLSCGKLSMKNMKRRAPCPRGPRTKRTAGESSKPDGASASTSASLPPRKKLKSAKQLRAELKRQRQEDDEDEGRRAQRRHFKKLRAENRAKIKEMQELIRDSERLEEEVRNSLEEATASAYTPATTAITTTRTSGVIDLSL